MERVKEIRAKQTLAITNRERKSKSISVSTTINQEIGAKSIIKDTRHREINNCLGVHNYKTT